MIPVAKPYFTQDEEQAAVEAIKSGWVVQGPRVLEFEQCVAKYTGAKFAVATSSCTAALHLALIALGIGPGDEVLVPSFSFIATANSVLHAGAKPVFVDIDPRTYNIDPALIERSITTKTRAVMPVHQVGLAADLDAIHAVAGKHNLIVLEDAATIIGGEYKGRKIGSHSRAVCFSFHPRKAITTGEGGMVTTDNADLAGKLAMLRSHGASISDLARHRADSVVIEDYPVLGYNYRMTDIQGAIGVAQMRKLDWILQRRREIGQVYSRALSDIQFVEVPFEPSYAKHTYQSYCLRLKPQSPKSRDQVMSEMQSAGIATRRGVMAIHLEPFYRETYGDIPLPETEEASRATLLLPMFPQMTTSEQNQVVDTLRAVLGAA